MFVSYGRFMAHCQEYSCQVEDDGPPFLNISFYGNETSIQPPYKDL